MWSYEKYSFNGFFNQRIPSSKFETKEEAVRCRDLDLSFGIYCGELKLLPTMRNDNTHRQPGEKQIPASKTKRSLEHGTD